jgi:DNA modification methylase
MGHGMSKPRVEVLPIEEGATPDPNNINKHTQRGGGLLENSLRKRGAFRSIASAGKDAEKPVVYAGNYTLEKAIDAGFTEVVNVHVTGNQLVNVVRDDLAPGSAEAIALGLEDNEIGKQSYNPDLDILAAVMADPAMQTLRDEDRILAGLVDGMGLPKETKDAEPQVDRAAELLEKWQVKPGDLWQIGDHRLLCGDSTKREDYSKLMEGETASMCFTSPPYNQGGKAFRLPAFYKGEGDNKTKDEYYDFLLSVLNCLKENMNNDAALLWNVSYNSQSRDDYGRIVFSLENPFHVMETIIWDKKHGFNVSARGILSRDSELVFLLCWGDDYFTNQGRYDTWYNTWRIGTIGAQTEGHGAAYPVELVEKGLSCFSAENAIILEPFCGTGTNIIACQNLSRRGRAIEISPAYCAVTLERMATAFPGIEIKRL